VAESSLPGISGINDYVYFAFQSKAALENRIFKGFSSGEGSSKTLLTAVAEAAA
jgi:hypothetical protein